MRCMLVLVIAAGCHSGPGPLPDASLIPGPLFPPFDAGGGDARFDAGGVFLDSGIVVHFDAGPDARFPP